MTTTDEKYNRIKQIEVLLSPLLAERTKLEQEILESYSAFKVGDMIEWNEGKRKGRVVRIIRWCGIDSPAWRVIRIRKDGSDGEQCEVRNYMHPVLFKSAPPAET